MIVRVLGIDPGISSGSACIYGTRGLSRYPTILDMIDLPTKGDGPAKRIDVAVLQQWIAQNDPQVAYIENAGAMPKQGIATTSRYMRAAGAVEATVTLCGVDGVLVAPGSWKRAVGLLRADKRASLELVRSLFPGRSWFDRQKDHNRAESALLALYGAMRCDLVRLEAA